MLQAFEFINTEGRFSVQYNSKRRPVGNLRDEFNIDAANIFAEAGPIYIALSSGVDSQIITRCFLDQSLDAEYVFLHLPGYNDVEFRQLDECKKYFGIDVRIVSLDINLVKDEWMISNAKNKVNCISQYPFQYLSSQLPGEFPIVTQGKMEPSVVGVNKNKMAIYHNYYESMELRFSLMSPYRKVYDFPYSPEAITSYYTDVNMKTFVSNIKYFTSNNCEYTQYFNTFAKSFVKGSHFDDVIWFPKLNGSEDYPTWLLEMGHSVDTRVSVPYWDLVEFLENTTSGSKIYKEWIFKK